MKRILIFCALLLFVVGLVAGIVFHERYCIVFIILLIWFLWAIATELAED